MMIRRSRTLALLATGVMSLGGLLAVTEGPASASAVTLYVGPSGTAAATSGCATSGAGACITIGEAIAVAEAMSNTAVTIDVAAGTYSEHDVVDAENGDTIDFEGASAATTTVDGSSTGIVFVVEGVVGQIRGRRMLSSKPVLACALVPALRLGSYCEHHSHWFPLAFRV